MTDLIFYDIKHSIKKYKSNYWLLWFIAAIYPLIVIPNPLPFSTFPRYILLAIVSMIALVQLTRQRVQLNSPVYFALLAFLLFGFLSVSFTEDPIKAWVGNQIRFTGFSTYLFCAILFVTASKNEAPMKIVKAMVGCAIVVSLIAVLQYYGFDILPQNIISESFRRSYGTLGNPIFLGTYAVFTLPAALMLYLNDKRPVWLVISGFIFAALLTSGTRGSWLAFAAIYAIFIYYFVIRETHHRRKMLIITVAFILVYLVINTTGHIDLTGRASTIGTQVLALSGYSDSPVDIRIFYWQESFKIISGNWIFGVGPDNLLIERLDGILEDKAHNIFLDTLTTMGIFAFITYLSIIGLSLRAKGDWTKTTLNLMIIAYIFQGQFNFDVISVLPLFWIVLGLKHANSEGELYTGLPKECGVSNKVPKKISVGGSKAFIYLSTFFVSLFVILAVLFFIVPRQGTVEIQGQGTYTGEYRGINTFHGDGELVLLNGMIYRGGFRHGSFHGMGTINYANGSSYSGEFKEGYFHGEGKFIFPDGRIQEGRWEKGIFVRY